MPETRDPQLDDLRRRARRRLVGAIVLALAAAVLVPMLLESDPKPLGEDVSVKIPPIDDGKFVSKVGERGMAAEPPRAAPKAEQKPDPVAVPSIPAELPKDATPEPRRETASSKSLASAEQRVLAPPAKAVAGPPADSARVDTTKDVAAKAPEAPKGAGATPAVAKADAPAGSDAGNKPAEAPKAGAFSVQLAAFIDDKGANALAGRLKRSGYPAYTEPYATSRGTLWRVRVGPYPSRDAAEATRAKLKGEGHNGIIAAVK